MSIEWVRTPDILQAIAAAKGERFVVGFAAETQNLIANARQKLEAKGLDLIVANDVSGRETGFDSDDNAAQLLDRWGGSVEVPRVSKRELADQIWDRIGKLLAARKASSPVVA